MPAPHHSSTRRTIGIAALALCLSVAGLLLWTRLKLVAGIPRSAYAEPKAAASDAPPSGTNAQTR